MRKPEALHVPDVVIERQLLFGGAFGEDEEVGLRVGVIPDGVAAAAGMLEAVEGAAFPVDATAIFDAGAVAGEVEDARQEAGPLGLAEQRVFRRPREGDDRASVAGHPVPVAIVALQDPDAVGLHVLQEGAARPLGEPDPDLDQFVAVEDESLHPEIHGLDHLEAGLAAVGVDDLLQQGLGQIRIRIPQPGRGRAGGVGGRRGGGGLLAEAKGSEQKRTEADGSDSGRTRPVHGPTPTLRNGPPASGRPPDRSQ